MERLVDEQDADTESQAQEQQIVPEHGFGLHHVHPELHQGEDLVETYADGERDERRHDPAHVEEVGDDRSDDTDDHSEDHHDEEDLGHVDVLEDELPLVELGGSELVLLLGLLYDPPLLLGHRVRILISLLNVVR